MNLQLMHVFCFVIVDFWIYTEIMYFVLFYLYHDFSEGICFYFGGYMHQKVMQNAILCIFIQEHYRPYLYSDIMMAKRSGYTWIHVVSEVPHGINF